MINWMMSVNSPHEFERQVIAVLEQQLSRHTHDYLFTVSMDHRPSEQLNDTAVHTSVLILSCGIEHADLARSIAAKIRPKHCKLVKWSHGASSYRERFARSLAYELKHYPVYIFALSALGEVIRNAEDYYLNQLGVGEIYKKSVSVKGKKFVEFGPYFKKDCLTDPLFVRLPEHRAIMVLHIAHFVQRIHSRMWLALRSQNKDDNYCLNWNFLADKFPGPPDADMDLMFSLLMSRTQSMGRILWGYFLQGDQAETDLLADNLAGVINESKIRPNAYPALTETAAGEVGGIFYVETWNKSCQNLC